MLDTAIAIQSESFTLPDTWLEPLAAERISTAKAAFSTRRVCFSQATSLLCGQHSPRAGDLVLARVTRLGQHSRIELATGRRARLHIGDEVIVCYGNRYAPDQFEAV